MTKKAIKGFGVKLGIGNGATPTEVFTDIAELATDLSGPDLSRETIETTSHDSPDEYNTHIAGLKEGGEVSVGINYLPTEATHKNTDGGLLYLFESGEITNFQLTFPNTLATKWILPVIVTGFKPTSKLKEKLDAEITLKVAGKPTLI